MCLAWVVDPAVAGCQALLLRVEDVVFAAEI
jgi:hypothetical protein